jgi:hypothetical protein
VAWNGKRLQLRESSLRPLFVKAEVQAPAYRVGSCTFFLGPRRLAD